MSMRAALAALAGLALATPGMAAVDVRVSGQAVDVQASNAPLSEILDRLSRQTQMKVVYDGAPPRQTVTLDLRGRTVVEAVVAALEGQGVNYALAMDATGTRVETLLVSGTATASTSKAGVSLEDRRSAARDMPPPPPPEPVLEEAEPVAEEEAQAPSADTSAGLNLSPGGVQTKEGVQPPEAGAPAPQDPGLGGFSSSPFAPRVAKPEQPQPQATPPPFNP